jgi:hypothetical protein
MPPIPSVYVPALLAELLGHRTLTECATISGYLILPKGGVFGGRAYRPADDGQTRNIDETITAAHNHVRKVRNKAKAGGDVETFLTWCLEYPAQNAPSDPVHDHARALLAAFGGNYPDWLAPEATALERALALTSKDI